MALPLSYNLRNLKVRWQLTLLAVGGIALVVAVLVVLMAMAQGFSLALRATGSADNGIVTQRGSNSELTSGISQENAATIIADGRIARNDKGEILASPENVVVANLKRRADGQPTNVLIRGVTPVAFEVRRGIKLVAGRRFQPGLYEVMVGKRIAERIQGLDVGGTIKLQRKDWQVVGIYTSDGSGFESEIWADRDAMAPAFNRGGGYQSITLRLQDPSTLPAFNEQLKADPQFQVKLDQELKYYSDQAGSVSGQLMALAIFVAIVMGFGAVFGAMNTMNGIVAARTREIATLRALGFSRLSILVSFVIESTLLALVAGTIGCLLALPANGFTSATGNANFSELAFAFRITPAALAGGLVFALVMGVIGGLLPAIRAARMPIATALREA